VVQGNGTSGSSEVVNHQDQVIKWNIRSVEVQQDHGTSGSGTSGSSEAQDHQKQWKCRIADHLGRAVLMNIRI
jgi:hypothetical protein